jgi:hypothetical protein
MLISNIKYLNIYRLKDDQIFELFVQLIFELIFELFVQNKNSLQK